MMNPTTGKHEWKTQKLDLMRRGALTDEEHERCRTLDGGER
jgi:hypothetical protein